MNTAFINYLACLLVFWWTSIAFASFGLHSAQPWTNKFQLKANQVAAVNQTAGEFQDLFPIYGNLNNIWYFDTEYKNANTSEYISGIGGGARFLRSLMSDLDTIFGVFAYADYQGLENTHAWYINPGFEIFTLYQNLTA